MNRTTETVERGTCGEWATTASRCSYRRGPKAMEPVRFRWRDQFGESNGKVGDAKDR
jgi:hypothetical protein